MRSIFPSKPSVPFVFDCCKWHKDLCTSLTVIKGSALASWLIFSVQYCSSRLSSLMGELYFLITLLATLQKWLFTSSGEIPLVVLVFAGGCLLVRRLIARHVSFEFLLCAKVSEKKCLVSCCHRKIKWNTPQKSAPWLGPACCKI